MYSFNGIYQGYDVLSPPRSVVHMPSSKNYAATPTTNGSIPEQPHYLQWDASPVRVPSDWSFEMPNYCDDNATQNFIRNAATTTHDNDQKIIVHLHLQHIAGTNFYYFAWRYTPCSTHACFQTSKHCLVSYNEEVEADNIRQNYQKYGVQYVAYELMLPPRFPLPFVSDSARRGLFFTTIMRNPWERYLTRLRWKEWEMNNRGKQHFAPLSLFWMDLQHRKKQRDPYLAANLNVRWLSGAQDQTISREHINLAKCRLQLFDLVIVDQTYNHAVKEVTCPMNGWMGHGINSYTSDDPSVTPIYCNNDHDDMINVERKPDLLNNTDKVYIGALIERLLPSFELYDYARILSWKQLKERGVHGLPDLSKIPSYVGTLAKYTGMNEASMSGETFFMR